MTAERAAEPDAATPSTPPDEDAEASREGDGKVTDTPPSADAAAAEATTAAATQDGANETAPPVEPAPVEPAVNAREPEPAVPPAPEPAAAAQAIFEALEQELETLRAQRNELTEKLLRTAADFDNYRKRTRRELDEARMRGRDETIREVLPIFDNLERAVAAASSSQESGAVLEGVRMVLKLFEDTAQRMGMSRVPSVGARFDPAVHEALQQVETDEVAPGTVLTEVTPGYVFGKRLLRAALVIVARKPTEPKVAPNSETIRAEPLVAPQAATPGEAAPDADAERAEAPAGEAAPGSEASTASGETADPSGAAGDAADPSGAAGDAASPGAAERSEASKAAPAADATPADDSTSSDDREDDGDASSERDSD